MMSRSWLALSLLVAAAAASLVAASALAGKPAPVPRLAFDPATYTFADVPVGQTASQEFTLTFSGNGIAGPMLVWVSDDPAFSIPFATNDCIGTTLSTKNPSCSLTVEYTPTSAGQTDTTTLNVLSLKAGKAYATLTGTSPAESTCTGGSENFGDYDQRAEPTTFQNGAVTIDSSFYDNAGRIYIIPADETKEWAEGTHLLASGASTHSLTLTFTNPVGRVTLDGQAHNVPFTMTLSAYDSNDTLVDSDSFDEDIVRHTFTVSSDVDTKDNDIKYVTLTVTENTWFWFTDLVWSCLE